MASCFEAGLHHQHSLFCLMMQALPKIGRKSNYIQGWEGQQERLAG